MTSYFFDLKYSDNINSKIYAKKYNNIEYIGISSLYLLNNNSKLGLGQYGPNISINNNYSGNIKNDSITLLTINNLNTWSIVFFSNIYDFNSGNNDNFIIHIPNTNISINISYSSKKLYYKLNGNIEEKFPRN